MSPKNFRDPYQERKIVTKATIILIHQYQKTKFLKKTKTNFWTFSKKILRDLIQRKLMKIQEMINLTIQIIHMAHNNKKLKRNHLIALLYFLGRIRLPTMKKIRVKLINWRRRIGDWDRKSKNYKMKKCNLKTIYNLTKIWSKN